MSLGRALPNVLRVLSIWIEDVQVHHPGTIVWQLQLGKPSQTTFYVECRPINKEIVKLTFKLADIKKLASYKAFRGLIIKPKKGHAKKVTILFEDNCRFSIIFLSVLDQHSSVSKPECHSYDHLLAKLGNVSRLEDDDLFYSLFQVYVSAYATWLNKSCGVSLLLLETSYCKDFYEYLKESEEFIPEFCTWAGIDQDTLTGVREIDLEEHKCASCQAPSKTKCKACNSIYYCNQDCQKNNWTEHQEDCELLQERVYFQMQQAEEVKKICQSFGFKSIISFTDFQKAARKRIMEELASKEVD